MNENDIKSMKTQVIKNGQITKIIAQDLERLPHRTRYDSTIDERQRSYDGKKFEPRFSEYR